MFRKCDNLDERQLLQRGNVFQHTCLLLFVLILFNGFLKSEGIVWAEGIYESLIMLWAAFTLCFCEFIIREITPLGSGMKAFYIVMGIAGAFMIVTALAEHFYKAEPLASAGMLTTLGGVLVEGSFMTLILLVFAGKSLYNHLKVRRGDED